MKKMKSQKKKNFEIKKRKRRGQKRKNPNQENIKRIHSKNDFDNLISGVQVHFMNFIINLSNDIISSVITSESKKNEDLKFKDISYEIKKNITFDNLEKIKTSSIKEILQNPVSKKFKVSNFEYYNKEIYDKVINKGKWLSQFFDMNYMDLFKDYYFNKSEQLRQIIIKGKEINLTNKTKSFFELYRKSNDERKKLLIQYINRAYFGIVKEDEKIISKTKNIFKTTK